MKKKNNHLFENCKYYYGEVDYDTSYNCDDGCDPYCRCGEIENERMTSIDYNAIAQDVMDYLNCEDDNVLYPLSKYIEKTVNSDSFNIHVENGYYGQEIGSIELNSGTVSVIIEYAQNLINKSSETLITEGLIQEHGYLLNRNESISDVINHEWKLSEFLDKLVITNFNPNKEKIQKLIDAKYFNGFITKDDNGKMKLIDGHHRFQALINSLFNNDVLEIFDQKSLADIKKKLKRKLNRKISFKEIIISSPIKDLEERISKLENRIDDLEYRTNDESRDYH
jgi:polyhydroxyalkanoate synthesis regulator phasin